MSTVLVTGAGGYIGTTLIPLLLKDNFNVMALDRFFFGMDLLPPKDGLVCIREDVRKLGEKHFEGIDYVIDLVALSNDSSGELFQNATNEINFKSRVNTAILAKKMGVKRYILPSSCSVYGYQKEDVIVNETSPVNPLTTYSKANYKAEQEILPLKDKDFCVCVLRQATVYGYSKRMRFDLAINGMTYGAWKDGRLPLMRDGKQWRPMIHVQDAARALLFMLEIEAEKINGRIFNTGSENNNYQIGPLGEMIAGILPNDIEIEWYGDPDKRSYRVSFDKIYSLGYRALFTAIEGTLEIVDALQTEKIAKNTRTITLDWYKELAKWHRIIKDVEMYGGVVEI